jgi:ribosomal protein L14E/L6E/L27E
MGKLNNPVYREGVQEKYVYVTPPELVAEVTRLCSELAAERAKPPSKEVVYVDKVVDRIVMRDDPALLHNFNAMAKENGELKMRLNRIAHPALVTTEIEPAPQQAEVVKIVRVETINKKYIAAAVAAGAVSWPLFTLLGRLIASFLT